MLGLWFDVVVVVDEIDNGGCFLWLLVIFGNLFYVYFYFYFFLLVIIVVAISCGCWL